MAYYVRYIIAIGFVSGLIECCPPLIHPPHADYSFKLRLPSYLKVYLIIQWCINTITLYYVFGVPPSIERRSFMLAWLMLG